MLLLMMYQNRFDIFFGKFDLFIGTPQNVVGVKRTEGKWAENAPKL